jgi:hypothetical protein
MCDQLGVWRQGRLPWKPNDVDQAIDTVVGTAGKQQAAALQEGREHPLELFYALLTFTNLDNLAFELQEALLPSNARPIGRIERQLQFIRRHDLIVEALDKK